VALLIVPQTTPAGTAPAAADSVSKRKQAVQSELSQVRSDLEGTSKDLVEATVSLRRAQLALVDARAVLAAAQAGLADARARDDAVAVRLAVAQAEVAKAERALATNRAEQHRTRAAVSAIAREAYLTSGTTTLSLALQADSPDQFTQRMAIAGTALRVQNGALARLGVQEAESRARSAKLAALRATVAEVKDRSEALVRGRQAAEAKAHQAGDAVAHLVAQQSAALKVIASKKAAEFARLGSLAREQARLQAILAARARRAHAGAHVGHAGAHVGHAGAHVGHAGSGSQVSGGGVLSYPASGPITSGFGWRMHPIFHIRRLHTGTDFGVGCGTPVHAAADGTVIMAGWAGGYGNRVVVDHGVIKGVDLATTYNHLASIVRRGGHVGRGQVIAYSGTTGSSTGCHLHFEVLVNGSYVNPMGWL